METEEVTETTEAPAPVAPPKPPPVDVKIKAMAAELDLPEGIHQYLGGHLVPVTEETRTRATPDRPVVWQTRVPPGGMRAAAQESAPTQN